MTEYALELSLPWLADKDDAILERSSYLRFRYQIFATEPKHQMVRFSLFKKKPDLIKQDKFQRNIASLPNIK